MTVHYSKKRLDERDDKEGWEKVMKEAATVTALGVIHKK